MQFEQHFVDVNGVKTEYYSAGTGEPLVFLHGAGTVMSRLKDLTLAFAKDFKVILPFHPGFGNSDDNNKMKNMHDYVLHYLELLDKLDLKHFNLVGHSLGAWISALFAIEQSDRIKRLTLACPPGLKVPGHPGQTPFGHSPEKMMSLLLKYPETAMKFAPRPDDIDAIVQMYREMTSTARVTWETGSYDRTINQWLHRISVPTLMLWGSDDRFCPTAHAEEWAKRIPNAEVCIIDDCAHLIFEEKPLESVEAIRRFFLNAENSN